jgi:hypothetical protein
MREHAEYGSLCQFQAAAITYFALASICWLGTIAVSNYSLVIRRRQPSFWMVGREKGGRAGEGKIV